MKRKALCLLLMSLLLTGCGKEVIKSSGTDASPLPTSSLEEDNGEYRWDKDVDANLALTLGEYVDKLPIIDANSYESLNEKLDSGVTYTRISAYCDESEDKALVYRIGLKFLGWDVEFNAEDRHYEGYIRVSLDTLLLVTFGSTKTNGKEAVTLATWLFNDKVKEFPNNKVMEFSGHEVPVLKADCYTFATGSMYGISVLEITAYGVKEADYLDYLDLLSEQGWDVQQYYDSYSALKTDWKLYDQLTYYDVETAMASNIETDRPVVTMDFYIN